MDKSEAISRLAMIRADVDRLKRSPFVTLEVVAFLNSVVFLLEYLVSANDDQ